MFHFHIYKTVRCTNFRKQTGIFYAGVVENVSLLLLHKKECKCTALYRVMPAQYGFALTYVLFDLMAGYNFFLNKSVI